MWRSVTLNFSSDERGGLFFSNSAGDKFYLRLAADSDLFLSKELASF